MFFKFDFALLKKRIPYWILVLGCLYLLFIFLFIFLWDKEITRWVGTFSPEIIKLAKSISGLIKPEASLIIWPCLFGLTRFHLKKPSLSFVCLYVSIVLAFSNLITSLIKTVTGRARPELFLEKGIYTFKGIALKNAYVSFPSGHAATALAITTALAFLFPRFRYLFIFLGLVLSLSRVVLLDHFISDILGSAFIALMSAFYVQYQFKKNHLQTG